MQQDLEQLLAYHCAPALAGIKAGCLVSCTKENYPNLEDQVAYYAEAFRPLGVRFELMCTCHRASLLLVYRPALLREHLAQPLAGTLLEEAGYPNTDDLDQLLDYLRMRLHSGSGEFPHEIGLFLGYPPEDVEGFQRHHGQDFKLCGQWKVYSDVERAKVLFGRYNRCRDAICRRLSQGRTMTQLFQVA